jgi:hypothetical protein
MKASKIIEPTHNRITLIRMVATLPDRYFRMILLTAQDTAAIKAITKPIMPSVSSGSDFAVDFLQPVGNRNVLGAFFRALSAFYAVVGQLLFFETFIAHFPHP